MAKTDLPEGSEAKEVRLSVRVVSRASCKSPFTDFSAVGFEWAFFVDPAQPLQPPDPRAICADAGEPFEDR